jgi:hypothetical protein
MHTSIDVVLSTVKLPPASQHPIQEFQTTTGQLTHGEPPLAARGLPLVCLFVINVQDNGLGLFDTEDEMVDGDSYFGSGRLHARQSRMCIMTAVASLRRRDRSG